jgi:chromosome partitioning protein
MTLLSFCNTKGGVGKSTLASHLAIWLYDRGYRVALLDADDQQTAAQWVRHAEPNIHVVTASDTEAIRTAKKNLLVDHDVIVADSPGKAGDASATIALLSDACIVPLQPSLPDLRAIQEALKFIRLAQELTGGQKPQATLVLTFTAHADLQARRLREQLKTFAVTVARSEFRRRNAFRDAADSAVTRQRSREGIAAAQDIDALFNELFGELLARLHPNLQTKEING